MSKYSQIRSLMGRQEFWNDGGKYGRILKWYADTRGATKAERDAMAAEIMERLTAARAVGVQKVRVMNAVSNEYGMKSADYDKICVYMDRM